MSNGPRVRAADDVDVIRKRLGAITGARNGYCAIRCGKPSVECWCYQGGPDSETLPCPPPAPASDGDGRPTPAAALNAPDGWNAEQSANARLAEVGAIAAAHPGDRFVLTSVQSLKAHADTTRRGLCSAQQGKSEA